MTMPPPPPGGFPQDPNQQPYGQQPAGDPYGQPAAGGYGQPPAYGGPNPYDGGSGQKNNLGGWALGLGIAGLLCCGIFAGIPAIILGRMSQQAAEQGQATNGGMGKAGFILGIVACVWFVIALILRFTGVIDTSFNFNN